MQKAYHSPDPATNKRFVERSGSKTETRRKGEAISNLNQRERGKGKRNITPGLHPIVRI